MVARLARRTSALGRLTRQLVSWWIAELAGMLPHRLLRLLDRSATDGPIVVVAPDGARLSRS